MQASTGSLTSAAAAVNRTRRLCWQERHAESDGVIRLSAAGFPRSRTRSAAPQVLARANVRSSAGIRGELSQGLSARPVRLPRSEAGVRSSRRTLPALERVSVTVAGAGDDSGCQGGPAYPAHRPGAADLAETVGNGASRSHRRKMNTVSPTSPRGRSRSPTTRGLAFPKGRDPRAGCAAGTKALGFVIRGDALTEEKAYPGIPHARARR